MDPLDWIDDELDELRRQSLFRDPAVVSSAAGTEIEIDGRRYISAASNNYLGLADDRRVVAAAVNAVERWGSGSGASPLVSGLTELERSLERSLAEFKGCDDAVIFSSGFLANLGCVQALVGAGDVVFSDELNHASIIDACRLSRARVSIYRHCDLEHLRSLVSAGGHRRALIVTDSVFSMDGDLAPLPGIVEIARECGAMTMVDEAHATGVIGAGGGGGIEHFGLTGQVDAVMGTLSKALGSAGGFVAGSAVLTSWMRNKARSLIFDTAPAPAALGGAAAALEIVKSEPERRARLRSLRQLVTTGIRALGYEVAEGAAAVIPVMVGDADAALDLAAALRENGVFAPAIRPPSVAAGTARVRLTVMATHTDAHAEQIVAAFA